MKKRLLALALATSFIFTGCGNDAMIVEDYPIEGEKTVTKDTEATNVEQSTSTAEVTETKTNRTISYEINDSKGNVKYKVDAEVIGDERNSYSTAKIDYLVFTDDVIKSFVDATFDNGSVSMVMPRSLADLNYVNDRISLLEERKQAYSNEEDIPRYITLELDELELLRDENNFSNGPKIECPQTPSVISLNDYYANKGIQIGDINFCLVEGTINGIYHRMDFITFLNSRTIRLYRLQSNPDCNELYALAEDESYLPPESDGEPLTRETAEKEFNEYLSNLNGAGLITTDIYPIRIVGDFDYSKMLYQKPGYACFASPNIDGLLFPNTSLTTFCSYNSSTNLMLDPQEIGELDTETGWIEMSTMETGSGSGAYYNGYQSVVGAFDNKGLVEMYLCNMMTDAGQNFEYKQDTSKITFEEADEIAQKYMSYLSDHNDGTYTSAYNYKEISKIELGMCRIVSEGDYYIVPAWYYLKKSDTMNLLPDPVVVVNAIDGSIIDLEKGGITVEF